MPSLQLPTTTSPRHSPLRAQRSLAVQAGLQARPSARDLLVNNTDLALLALQRQHEAHLLAIQQQQQQQMEKIYQSELGTGNLLTNKLPLAAVLLQGG